MSWCVIMDQKQSNYVFCSLFSTVLSWNFSWSINFDNLQLLEMEKMIMHLVHLSVKLWLLQVHGSIVVSSLIKKDRADNHAFLKLQESQSLYEIT